MKLVAGDGAFSQKPEKFNEVPVSRSLGNCEVKFKILVLGRSSTAYGPADIVVAFPYFCGLGRGATFGCQGGGFAFECGPELQYFYDSGYAAKVASKEAQAEWVFRLICGKHARTLSRFHQSVSAQGSYSLANNRAANAESAYQDLLGWEAVARLEVTVFQPCPQFFGNLFG